jgi:curved DNA-binding protein CbpA
MAAKTYYDSLGVSTNATTEQIREAYLIRSKMFHPDRFDPSRQANEWRLANEMLKELNHAYTVLKDPKARSAYDSTLLSQHNESRYAPPPRRDPPPQPAPKPPVNPGTLECGYSRFSLLPQHVRTRISERTSGKNKQQFITSLQGIGWNYFLLLLFAGCFVLIFVLAQNDKWTEDGKHWMLGMSIVASVFVVRRRILTSCT